MKIADQPAFPSEFEGPEKDEFGMPLIVHRKCYGLTKREYLAAAAMQGMLANSFWAEQDVAEQAIRYADELLKQLES